jgi:cobalt/nickel transport system permease protein
VKILGLLALLISVATLPLPKTTQDASTQSAAVLAAYGVLLSALVLATRLPLVAVLDRAALVLPFALTFAAASWLSGDHPRAIVLVARSYVSALAALVLIATTPLAALARGLESLGAPRVLVLVMQFLYRYLFVLSEQAQHMRAAAACRGMARLPLTPNSALFRNAAGALAVLFARSQMRADGIHRAMLSRGGGGKFPQLAIARLTGTDVLFLAAAILVCAALRLTMGVHV